jgi:heme exporter protein D
MSQFFDMGGYAAYVWPAYAVTLAIVGLNILWARRLLTQAYAAARRRLAAQSAPGEGEGT